MPNSLNPEVLLPLLMGEDKAKEYLSIAGRKKHTYIRLNPLKASVTDIIQLLKEQGFELSPLNFYTQAYRVEYEPFPISKSLAYFAGLIYLQDPSSMLPALVLNPIPGDRVLDLTAAPGSKTTLLATLMKGQGALVACDSSAKRLRALSYNIERWGAINTAWVKVLGEQIGNLFFEYFDKVLVDPPCSALGTLHKSPEILRWWKDSKVIKLARLQERLLISGLKALKPGGELVYSTCTLTPHENEAVIQAVLERYPVELEEIIIPEGFKATSGLIEFQNFQFSEQLKRAIRIYPVDNPSEGFFVAKLRKKDAFKPPAKTVTELINENWQPAFKFKQLDLIKEHFGITENVFEQLALSVNNHIRLTTRQLAALSSPLSLQKGISFARPMGKRWRLTTNGMTWLGRFVKRNCVNLDLNQVRSLISGHNLPAPSGHKGQQLLTCCHCPLGYGWIKGDKLISQLPSREIIV